MQTLWDSSTTTHIAVVKERQKTAIATSFKIYDQSFKEPSVESQRSFTNTGTGKSGYLPENQR